MIERLICTMRTPIRLATLILSGFAGYAQQRSVLSLDQAVQRAVQNHPAIASASLNAQTAGTIAPQVHAAAQPLLTANFTTVGADPGSAIAAGALQTSGLASRAATGLGFAQPRDGLWQNLKPR